MSIPIFLSKKSSWENFLKKLSSFDLELIINDSIDLMSPSILTFELSTKKGNLILSFMNNVRRYDGSFFTINSNAPFFELKESTTNGSFVSKSNFKSLTV